MKEEIKVRVKSKIVNSLVPWEEFMDAYIGKFGILRNLFKSIATVEFDNSVCCLPLESLEIVEGNHESSNISQPPPTDAEMLDFLQDLMTDNDNYCEIYLAGLRNGGSGKAGSYQFETNPGLKD